MTLPEQVTERRSEDVTLALVALLRAASVGENTPPGQQGDAHVSRLVEALQQPTDTKTCFLDLETAAAAAIPPPGIRYPPVNVRYILYEADTGCAEPRSLPHKEYWAESSTESRNGLVETFWVVRRFRTGPFGELTVYLDRLPRCCGAPPSSLLPDNRVDEGP